MSVQGQSPLALMIYSATDATSEQFVQFWSRHYEYSLEDLYSNNIGKDLSPERLRELFIWKNGGKLSEGKSRSIERNFIARLGELSLYSGADARRSMLECFSKGGAIWRIFFLHCWRSDLYPIFDQHVYRAMRFIVAGQVAELQQNDEDLKIHLYLDEYVPFVDKFGVVDPRHLDRALWAFGKFLKTYPRAVEKRAVAAAV